MKPVNFSEIDAARQRGALSVLELSRRAGVAPSTYWFIRTGKVKPLPSTLKKYADGLALVPTPAKPNGDASRDALIAGAYRTALLYVAARLGLPPDEVLDKPRAREFWKARAIAMSATRNGFDIPAARLARALKTSKQLVHWSCLQVADMRDEGGEIDRIMEGAERAMKTEGRS